jgi:hypothetical protein
MNPNLVNKALSTEEQTILANIKSLTEELMSASAGSDMGAGTDVSTADKADLGIGGMLGRPGQEPDGDEDKMRKSKNEDIDNMDDKDKKAMLAKDITATPGDGTDANDDAEERMEDVLTGLTEENVEAVAKAIDKYRAKKVAKSASPSIVTAIMELSRVVKDISSRQMESETALSNVLEGLGVTKQIESAINEDRHVAKSGTPIFHDNDKVAKSLADVMTMLKGQEVKKEQGAGSNANTVRKNMDTAVSSLLGRK